ncbi:L-lactate dehydrogenase [Aphanothece sacrum]|uniref:L-lactate dehydrogenase n=1 Tax=Aphanothece sacrum FPU1 TaxID=1920663 RepID=A0A401INP9_APHSA|nr:L-lactate dehydrogenase [Aphanothece sacrum]GBF82873.1 L-lactate dehydrogenase [Aphanothece sacrum FPU1]
MFDRIFTSSSESGKPSLLRPRKGVIIGVGQVGMACAYSLLIQDCFDELILQDIAEDKVEGEVLDLIHGMSFLPPTDLKGGTLKNEGKDADMVIITAGAAQKPGESRLELVGRNVNIFKSILADVVKYCPNAILLIVSNPVDIMTYATLKLTGFPKARVIGSGTILDTGRFRSLLGKKFNIDPRSVHGYILGEHGDSEFPVWSLANIGGAKLIPGEWEDLPISEQNELNSVFEEVKNAAYQIIKLKGYTSYAIGLAVTDIVKAILRSQERILTVSSLINGLYGVEDICLSLPTVINEKGILKTVNLSLNEQEQAQLLNSAKVLKEVCDQLKF